MNYLTDKNNLVLEAVEDFDIEEILECGQCFHFSKISDKEYELLNYGRYLHIKQEADRVTLFDTDAEAYESLWSNFFDMKTNYGDIKNRLKTADTRLTSAIDAKPGVRILNQDFFETLISFIISQNKQIPHIKQIVHTLSERYGDAIDIHGRTVHSFPTAERLNAVTEDELRECRVGFRAPYIKDAVTKVFNGTIDERSLRSMNSTDCMNTLMTIKGVGPKVASCVMLFSLGKRDSFPIDVWMKRIMENMYFDGPAKKEDIEALAKKLYGGDSGYAQQYLFYYGRELNIGKQDKK
jgi:N-glycosylase/DNA lyase